MYFSGRLLDAERINAEDLRRILAEFDAILSSLITKEQEQLIQLLGVRRELLVGERSKDGFADSPG